MLEADEVDDLHLRVRVRLRPLETFTFEHADVEFSIIYNCTWQGHFWKATLLNGGPDVEFIAEELQFAFNVEGEGYGSVRITDTESGDLVVHQDVRHGEHPADSSEKTVSDRWQVVGDNRPSGYNYFVPGAHDAPQRFIVPLQTYPGNVSV